MTIELTEKLTQQVKVPDDLMYEGVSNIAPELTTEYGIRKWYNIDKHLPYCIRFREKDEQCITWRFCNNGNSLAVFKSRIIPEIQAANEFIIRMGLELRCHSNQI